MAHGHTTYNFAKFVSLYCWACRIYQYKIMGATLCPFLSPRVLASESRTPLTCQSRQPIFSPDSARIQPRFGTPKIKLKLAHKVGRGMPNPQCESFGGTPSRLTYRGQQRSRGSNLHSTLWLTQWS